MIFKGSNEPIKSTINGESHPIVSGSKDHIGPTDGNRPKQGWKRKERGIQIKEMDLNLSNPLIGKRKLEGTEEDLSIGPEKKKTETDYKCMFLNSSLGFKIAFQWTAREKWWSSVVVVAR